MKRRLLVVVLIAVGVVAVGAGTAVWIATRAAPLSAQEQAAQEYLDALAAGDAASVLSLLADPLPSGQAQTVGDAFRGASAYLSEPRVNESASDLSGDGDEATVTAHVRDPAGTSRSMRISLVHTAEGWRIEDALAPVTVTASAVGAPLSAVRVGDAVVAPGELELLPAAYSVAAEPAGLTQGEVDAMAWPGESAAATLAATLSPDAIAQVQERVDEYAVSCTVPAAAVPTSCGVSVPWGADLATLSQIRYRIETSPQVEISDDGVVTASDGVLVATAAGTTRTGEDAEFTYRTDRWSLYGTVSFDEGGLVVMID